MELDRERVHPQRIIRKRDLPTFTGLQRTALDDLIRAGKFPKPIPLGNRAVGWLEHDVALWQAERIARRDGTNADA
jgi:prophage regulatory protein